MILFSRERCRTTQQAALEEEETSKTFIGMPGKIFNLRSDVTSLQVCVCVVESFMGRFTKTVLEAKCNLTTAGSFSVSPMEQK